MTCGTKDGKIHIWTPLKAMRRKCLDCCCGSSLEVEKCPVHDCSLYPYRLGKSPTRKGIPMTEEQKKAAVKRLRKAQASKVSVSKPDKR